VISLRYEGATEAQVFSSRSDASQPPYLA